MLRRPPRHSTRAAVALVAGVALLAAFPAKPSTHAVEVAITTTYPTSRPRGLMVTSGGWAYCGQMRALALRAGYTLLCGRYHKDGFLGPGLRSRRHLDWGNARYLAAFAAKIAAAHRRVGGELLFIGVSYSGYGVAAIASHHPELRPDRVVVIDSYFDLVARRRQLLPAHETAREIDKETGGSKTALRRRSVGSDELARLVRRGTRLDVIWTISEHERKLFRGATCDRGASAATLAGLARALGRPVPGWVTRSRHGHNLWEHGDAIVDGRNPGRKIPFPPSGRVPPGSTCG